MSKIYIYSAMTNNQAYTLENGTEVVIAGRISVGRNLITPRGVVTSVDEDTFSLLQRVPAFAAQSANGFLSATSSKDDPESHAKKYLEEGDNSSQLTEKNVTKDTKDIKAARVRKGK